MENKEGIGKNKKPRILWCSDLVTPTGFSRVAHSIIKNLENEFEIVGVGVNYHGDPHNYKFPIFPASINMAKGPYGANRIVDLINGQDFDILFILNDAWVINGYLQAIKANVTKPLPKIVVYFPVDSTEHDPEWYSNFDIVSRAVTYTKFGEWVVKDANPTIDVSVIPHGIDTEIFHKTHATRLDAKIEFFAPYADKVGDLTNSFIVLNANRNQPRKKLDITMLGFAKFAKNKPEDVKLYMHTGMIDSSINVDKLATRYGISTRLIVSSSKKGVQNVSDERLNTIYNIADVGINTSAGEGWGLTNVEHAVTGAVQLVPNHSACRELFINNGLLMNTCGDVMFDNSMTMGKLVSSDEVAQKLEFLYRNPEERKKLAQLGYEKFTGDEYSWKAISKKWSKLFMEIIPDDDDSEFPQ
jgi:glycosyltransferase involved in cell wall biosynthesis